MLKKISFFLFPFLLLVLSGCYQSEEEFDDLALRTVPVTNNPQIVPRHGSSFPGMPTSNQ